MKLNPQCGSIDAPPSTRLQPEWSSRDRSAPSPGPDDPFPDRAGATGAGEPPHAARRRRCRCLRARARRLLAPAAAGKPTPAADNSANDKTLNWANWAAYIDEDDDGNYPTLVAFTDETGIEVNYEVAVDDNNTYYGKVKDQLALGQDIGADTVCLTDWMVEPLDPLRLHAGARPREHPEPREPRPRPAEPRLRPGPQAVAAVAGRLRRHLLEQGEASRTASRSVADLWNSELKGRVGVLSEMRDTMGLIMLENGVDISGDWGDDRVQRRARHLQRAGRERPDPQHQGQLVPRGPQERGHPRRDRAGRATSRCINAEAGDKWEFAIPDGRRHAVERQLPGARSARRARRTPRRSSTTTTSPRSPPRSPPG